VTWKRPSSLSPTKFFYGVKGKAKLWFESCFSNRYQRTSITINVLNQNYFSTVLNQNYFSSPQLKLLFYMGRNKTWSSVGINFGPFVVPFLC